MAKIEIPKPDWNSELVENILNLEKLRDKKIFGNVPKFIFFQLKNIFQTLETVGSSRIEGNHTTLSEYTEKLIHQSSKDEGFLEIENLEKAITFINENIKNTNINKAFLSELHKIITKNLKKEGSKNPGTVRKNNVAIKGSAHKPVSFLQVEDYYEEFIAFINKKYEPQNQILMVAVAHHRFTHIHPFDNGNGRLGRMLNYALLLKADFDAAWIINHSQIFYSNRNKYYKMLQKADSLKNKDVLEWCDYFILGLKNEMQKINALRKKEFVIEKILKPALKNALKLKHITEKNFKILNFILQQKEMQIKSQDLDKIGIKKSLEKTRAIKELRDKKIIVPIQKGKRFYSICFDNNILLRSIIDSLKGNGYVDYFLDDK